MNFGTKYRRSLVRMEGRGIMPPELFTVIQGRVEMQHVREEERKKHGVKRDRPDQQQPGGGSTHQLVQPSGGNPGRDQGSNYSRGSAVVKEEPAARGEGSRWKFSGNCFSAESRAISVVNAQGEEISSSNDNRARRLSKWTREIRQGLGVGAARSMEELGAACICR